jgi:hypothetical protein
MADTQPMWRQPPDDDELPEGLELGEPTCRGYGPVGNSTLPEQN